MGCMEDDDFASVHQELADRLEDIQLLVESGNVPEIARQLHSLKGLAKAFGLSKFADEVHAAEEVLPSAMSLQPRIDSLYRILDAA